jgi:hypothetical protein
MRKGVDGMKRQQDQEWDRIELTQDLLLARGEATGETLHQDLDAYSAYAAEVHSGRPSVRPQQQSITLLGKHAENTSPDRPRADGIRNRLGPEHPMTGAALFSPPTLPVENPGTSWYTTRCDETPRDAGEEAGS